MEELDAVVQTSMDLRGMSRCGIVVDLNSPKWKKMAMDDASVAIQDFRVREY